VQAANFQLSAGQYSKALASYEEALALFENMNNQRGIGRCNNNIAVAYMEMANEAGQAGDISTKTRYNGLSKIHIMAAINVARDEMDSSSTRTNSGGGSEEARTALVKTLGHYLHVFCTISLADLTEGGSYKGMGADEDSAALITAAQDSQKYADSTSSDPIRMLDCRCMLAALRVAVQPLSNQYLPDQWQEAERFVAQYLPNTPMDPPQCVLKQRLLVRKAADAEAKATSSGQRTTQCQAYADQLRMEALRTGPFCDLRSLIEAATALACRGEHRTYGAEALSAINRLAKVTSAKAVHFLLDYSGSMAGSQITSCVNSIKSIFEEHMSGDDHVALTTFNTSVRPKVPWMAKRGHESTISSGIGNCTNPGGGTAIWDAVVFAANPSKTPKEASGSLWICLLTDGEDNSSRNSVETAKQRIQAMTRDKTLKGLITISAGRGVTEGTKHILRTLAQASQSGLSIETGADQESIREAFGQAAAAMENELVLNY
jgi:uncharacterized protein YegL